MNSRAGGISEKKPSRIVNKDAFKRSFECLDDPHCNVARHSHERRPNFEQIHPFEKNQS
jgi:hypothetical protein